MTTTTSDTYRADRPAPWWTATGLYGSTPAVIRWDGTFTCPVGPPEALRRFLLEMVLHGFGDGSTAAIGLTPVLADWQAAAESAAREIFPTHLLVDTNFPDCWDDATVY